MGLYGHESIAKDFYYELSRLNQSTTLERENVWFYFIRFQFALLSLDADAGASSLANQAAHSSAVGKLEPDSSGRKHWLDCQPTSLAALHEHKCNHMSSQNSTPSSSEDADPVTTRMPCLYQTLFQSLEAKSP